MLTMAFNVRMKLSLICLAFIQGVSSHSLRHSASEGEFKIQNISKGYLEDAAGNRYALSALSPLSSLFSKRRFAPSLEGTFQKHMAANEVYRVSILRATYDDGSTLQVQSDYDGTIMYGELSKPNTAPVFFERTRACKQDELMMYSAEDLEVSPDSLLYFGDAKDLSPVPISSRISVPSDSTYEAGDGTFGHCAFYRVLTVGVVFDAEFCRKYNGKKAAKERIMAIVAAASLIFENEMCVQLQLSDIVTPDQDCNATSVFAPMNRKNACGDKDSFLGFFRGWMNDNRSKLGLDPLATFHAFTGYETRGALGCAYIGTACRVSEFGYGVNYMTSDLISTQSIIFAHELGHNLNARHLSDTEAGSFRYIMKTSVQNPNDGFSPRSIQRMWEWLDSATTTCNEIVLSDPTAVPTPTPSTARRPPSITRFPSGLPTLPMALPPTAIPPTSPPPSSIRPQNECKLEIRKEHQPFCISQLARGLFGCIDIMDLLPDVRPNEFCASAQSQPIRFAFLSCEEGGTEDTSASNDEYRELRPRGSWSVEMDGSSNDGPNRWGDALELSTSRQFEWSNDEGLDFLETKDCSALPTCSIYERFLCVATDLKPAQRETSYVATFAARLGSEAVSLWSLDLTVQKYDANDSPCLTAETICIEDEGGLY